MANDAARARTAQYTNWALQSYKAMWGTGEGFKSFTLSDQQKEKLSGYEGYDAHIRRRLMKEQYYMNLIHRGPAEDWREENEWAAPEWTAEERKDITRQRVQSYHAMQKDWWKQKYGTEEGFSRFRLTDDMKSKMADMSPEESWKYRLRQRAMFYGAQMHKGGPGPGEPGVEEEEEPDPPPRGYGGGSYGSRDGGPAAPLEERIAQLDTATPERTKSASGKRGWRGPSRGPAGETVHPDALPPIEGQQPTVGSRGSTRSGKGGY